MNFLDRQRGSSQVLSASDRVSHSTLACGMKSTVRVLLADDHALVRAGIRSLLGKIRGVEVVGEAADGREALQMIKDLHPDIALIDVTTPGLSGFEMLEESTRIFPELRVIVLATRAAAEDAMQALRAGAVGYLPKSAAVTELEEALETVARGETYVSGEVSKMALVEVSKGPNEQKKLLAKLTPRQREILILLAEGHSTKEISRDLNISVKTVESHRAQLMERLDIHEVAGLVRFAVRTGMVNVE